MTEERARRLFEKGGPGGPGRPPGTGEYDPSYPHRVIDLMGKGHSVTGVAGSFGVSRRTITNWANQHPDFADALEIGKAKRAMAYEEKAWSVANGNGGPGAANMIQFMLRNSAPDEYVDAQTHRHTGANGGPIQTVDLTNVSDEQLTALEAVFGPLAAARGDAGGNQG